MIDKFAVKGIECRIRQSFNHKDLRVYCVARLWHFMDFFNLQFYIGSPALSRSRHSK